MPASSQSIAAPASPSAGEGRELELELDEEQEKASAAAGTDWSFRFAVVFLAFYYIRPQDWIAGMAGVNVIRPIMLAWGLVLLGQGSRSPLRGWLRTPHDWAILAFYVYVVWSAPSEADAMKGMFSLVVFYYLTSQSLSTWENVLGYLKAWNVLLVSLATLGVLQTVGVDITLGKAVTDSYFGRLALGTWMADNPNALAHTVVAAIPLSYVLIFWRGTVWDRMVWFPTYAALAGWCAWETESKGAFLVGGGLTMLVFVVGRPRWIQILVVAAALTAGVGALSFLPRMDQMGDLRADEGVMGRLMAWEMAKTAMEQNTFGVGWKQFLAYIPWLEGTSWTLEPKSTHCSYVQIGADLGRYGLFFWLLGLWTAFRSMAFFKSEDETEERCRRATLLLVLAYAASNWMINREYHTEYYLLIAVASAVHRLRWAREAAVQEGETMREAEEVEADEDAEVSSASGSRKPRAVWKRLGILDAGMAALLVYGVLEVWAYILVNL
ncbi:O-antigen ligase family protein [Prosthecobacter sp.]|uniref:O-antigen ligase family protein n=1 Tax=Prosthecobacter sp. TaxID=1965333 RepID=UPI0037838D3F